MMWFATPIRKPCCCRSAWDFLVKIAEQDWASQALCGTLLGTSISLLSCPPLLTKSAGTERVHDHKTLTNGTLLSSKESWTEADRTGRCPACCWPRNRPLP